MAKLLMQLSEVITTENGRSLASQLELVKQRLAQRAASAAELSEAIRLAQALVESAMADVGTAEGELAAALEALKQAEAEVARLEQALADAPPEEQEAIRAQLEAAKGKVAEQQGQVDAATKALVEAGAVLDKALADLEQFKSEADKLDPNGSVSARGDERAKTNAALLGELERICKDRGHDLKLIKGPRPKTNSFLPEQAIGEKTKPEHARLMELAPQILDSDVYICGPAGWSKSVKSSLKKLGMDNDHIHLEEFAW